MGEQGLTDAEKELYGPSVANTVKTAKGAHLIRSLSEKSELAQAGSILADAFRDDEMFNEYIETADGRLSFYTSSIGAMSYFRMVLGCYDSDFPNETPRCVMACVPVLSKSQEEIEVFNSYEALVDHGFQVKMK